MRLGWLLLLLPLAAFGQNSANGNSNINFSTYLASPGPIGGTTPNTVSATKVTVTGSSLFIPGATPTQPTVGAIEPTSSCVGGCNPVPAFLLSGGGPPAVAQTTTTMGGLGAGVACPYADCIWSMQSGDLAVEFNHTLPFYFMFIDDNTANSSSVAQGGGFVIQQNAQSQGGLGAQFGFLQVTDASANCLSPDAGGAALVPTVIAGPCNIIDSLSNASSGKAYPLVLAIDAVLATAAFQKDSVFFALDESTPKKWLQSSFSGGVLTTTVNAASTDSLTIHGTTTMDAPTILKNYTVSGLPTCNSGTKYAMAAVTDATLPTYNAALTGGGAVIIPVFCNGTAWTAH